MANLNRRRLLSKAAGPWLCGSLGHPSGSRRAGQAAAHPPPLPGQPHGTLGERCDPRLPGLPGLQWGGRAGEREVSRLRLAG